MAFSSGTTFAPVHFVCLEDPQLLLISRATYSRLATLSATLNIS